MIPQQPEPFSARLRRETRKAHSLAEKSSFIRGFLRGTVGPTPYRQLLTALHVVYDVLDQVVLAAGDRPGIAQPFALPHLARTPSLKSDIAYFDRLAGPGAVPASGAARRYADHLRTLQSRDPDLVIGHAYTRYLGDLSGGQILAAVLRRSMALPEGEGTAFYTFAGIPDLDAFKARFRGLLDAVPDDEERRRAIVGEALVSFRLSREIFEEIECGRFAVLRAHLLTPLVLRPPLPFNTVPSR